MNKSWLVLAAFLLVPMFGCTGPGCPSGNVRVDGECEPYGPQVSGTGGQANASAGASASGGTSSEEGGANGETHEGVAFSEPCTTNADCGGETNYCAQPPAESSYCSVSGCDATPSLCPEGWSCFNVGQFIPGEPFVCLRPPAG